MSVEAITWALRAAEAGLVPSPTAAHVLIVLANYANGDNIAWPGQKNIAALVMRSERQVRRALEELEAAGLITAHERRRANGSRTSNAYQLHINIPMKQPDTHDRLQTLVNHAQPDTHVRGPRTPMSGPEPLVEPLDTTLRTVHQGSIATQAPPETEAAGAELSKHLERQRRVETRERLRDIERQVMQPLGAAGRRLAELMRELTMAGLDKRRWQLWLEAQVHPHLKRLGPDVFAGVLAEAVPRATGARDPRAFLAHALRGVNPPRRGATPQQALEELDLDALLGPLEEANDA